MAVRVAVIILIVSTMCLTEDVDYFETLGDDYDATKAHIAEVKQIMDCFNDLGPCTPLAASYKKYYPHIIIVACQNCNKSQKKSMGIFFDLVIKELSEEFKIFLHKNDPDNRYWAAFYDKIKYH